MGPWVDKFLRRITPRSPWPNSTWFRKMNFWIFPVEVFGIGPNTTAFGVLKPRQMGAAMAMISASVARAPSFNSTKAHGTSPHFPSGFATTAAPARPGGL